MSDEAILGFWRDQAREHGGSHAASWSDLHAIELELATIGPRLSPGDHVLDIGCGSGYSTLRLAAERDVSVRGVDYAPEMIDAARAALEGTGEGIGSRVEFDVGDILDLDEPSDRYDTVVVTRVVINVGDWERQRRALAEAVRVVKPGGTVLLSEASLEGWERINRFRAEWGLDPVPMPPFNNYLSTERVVEELEPLARLRELVHFSSSYYVLTRVVKPLLARAAAAPVDPADPETDWNRWSALVPPAGDYGVQVLFEFEKHAP
jgi:ubiquinone/menaquinone biosynthesis C-methylase UbiE